MKELILLIYLTVLSVFDLLEKKIPLIPTCIGLLAGVCFNGYLIITEPLQWKWTVLFILAGMLPGIFMLVLAGLTKKAGIGDGLILLILGMVSGYRVCLLLLCFSMLLTALFSVVLLLLRKADRHTRIPYLPFLTTVYLAGIFMRGG